MNPNKHNDIEFVELHDVPVYVHWRGHDIAFSERLVVAVLFLVAVAALALIVWIALHAG